MKSQCVDESDIGRYLGTIEERVRAGQTGAQWTLKSWAALGQEGTRDMRLRALTEAMYDREQTGEPVLLGSVSQSVAAHALCSVEIVRCRKKESGV